MRFFRDILLVTFIVLGIISMAPVLSQTTVEEGSATNEASEAESLRSQIDAKSAELKQLLEERAKIEEQLEQTGSLKSSLQKELKIIDYNISQLNLSIKANRVALEKLDLEIKSLNGNIRSIEKSIDNKKTTIGKLMVKLQQKDRENFLMILLKNQSLAESVSEAQSIATLNSDLVASAEELRKYQVDLVEKLSEEQLKQRQKEREQASLVNRQQIVQAQKATKNTILAQTKNQEKLYQEQLAELDKKQEEISKIIEEYEDQLRKSFDPSLLPVKRPGVIGFPVENPHMTQDYGPTKFAERAYRSKTHNGVDFRAPVGTPIMAVENGTVIAVDNNDRGTSRWFKYQYGKYVLIQHDNGLTSLYAHLSRQVVQKGQQITKGDVIGYSGDTGYSYGAHLHLTLLWTPSVSLKSIAPAAGLVPVGVTINPRDYLPNFPPGAISATAR
ncbi:MAG TPA: peptidoglycan DD-metalloendopeptidase family protein [Candidatus Paceibacterota bacterium]|nr:peptidoglycan DD-metalloendopeptidase family protein [Candidatus Paceibacterota bacterium]